MSYTRTPVGSIQSFATATIPSNWLLCDGSAVSRTTYAALFNFIGTAYGVGNGTTTFNVPDLRGRVPVAKDDQGGIAANRVTTAGSGVNGTTIGASGGTQTHVLSVGELANHGHTLTDPGHGHAVNDPGHNHGIRTSNGPNNNSNTVQAGDNFLYSQPTENGVTGISVSNSGTGVSVANTGSGSAHQNMQPVLITYYAIRT